jgi:hypothetical protein
LPSGITAAARAAGSASGRACSATLLLPGCTLVGRADAGRFTTTRRVDEPAEIGRDMASFSFSAATAADALPVPALCF